jgi:hypothetical protein
VVGIALIAAALSAGGLVFWITGVIALAGGILLFASGKRL